MNKILAGSILIICIASLIWFVSCGEKLGITKGVSVTADSTNPLRFNIAFETNSPAKAIVKYWTDDEIFTSKSTELGTEHAIRLIGLRANTSYFFRIYMTNDDTESESQELTFRTSDLPATLAKIDWKTKINNSFSGYILTQQRFVNGNIYLIDNKGEIVWYQDIPNHPKLAHWTKENSALVLYGDALLNNSAGDHVIEYDLFGNELLHIDLTLLDRPLLAHHDVLKSSDGSLIMLVYDERSFDLSEVGGKSDQLVLGDAIVLLDKNGKEQWRWSVFDHSDPKLDKEALTVNKEQKFAFLKRSFDDWSHGNALSVDLDGHYLISFRNWNQIWKVNSITGEVIWKLGEGGDLDMSREGFFSGQHSIHVNSKGEYMLFDNGREKRKTRVLSFAIDKAEKTADLKLNISLSHDFFSDRMGSAYLMENDNILVCAPRNNSILIIDSTGVLHAHADVGLPDPYRAEYVPNLYATHRE